MRYKGNRRYKKVKGAAGYRYRRRRKGETAASVFSPTSRSASDRRSGLNRAKLGANSLKRAWALSDQEQIPVADAAERRKLTADSLRDMRASGLRKQATALRKSTQGWNRAAPKDPHELLDWE